MDKNDGPRKMYPHLVIKYELDLLKTTKTMLLEFKCPKCWQMFETTKNDIMKIEYKSVN